MRRSILKKIFALALLTACSSDSLDPAAVQSLSGMDVSLAVPTLGVGQTTQALAILRDASGHSLTVSGGDTISWTSSNPAVATIAPNTGMVTAVSPGTSLISATAAGKTASATLTVSGAAVGPVSAVVLYMRSTAIGFGQSTPATATVLDAAGNVTTEHAVAWTSSSSNVALVSQAGMVTGLSAGTSTITASSEGMSGTLLVTVGAVPVNAIVVELVPGSIMVNGTSKATAIVKDVGDNVLTDRSVTWGSSNADVATVSQDGTVTGVASGLANITASVEGVTGSATIAVGNAPVANIAVSVKPQLFVQERAQAALSLTDASGNALTGRDVDWTSSNPSVVSVSSDGLVTGIAAGSATVTVTSEGKSATVPVSVVALITAAPTTINVSLSASTVSTAGGGTASATVLDQAGNPMSGQNVTWSSSSPSVATITSTGVYTAVGMGTATIRASLGSLSGTATLTVVASGATHLAFTTQPGGAISGLPLSSQPVVQLLDDSNSLVTGSSATVTASILSGSGTLVGTKTVAAVNGVARFSDLKLNGSSTNRLLFSSNGLTSVISSSINVTQIPASVVMRRQPSDGASGATLVTQPQIQVLDNAGLTYTGNALTIMAGIISGSGTLSGTTSVNTSNGIATFTNLVVTGGGNFVLGFGTTTPLLGVAANQITITAQGPSQPAQPTRISITRQPIGGVSGSTLSTQPTVELRDASNAVTSSTASVTVTAAPGTISGTTTVSAGNGVAAFTDLVVTGTGAQTLTFTSTGLPSATSSSFTMTAPTGPPATQLAITQQPSGSVSGVMMTGQPVVEVRTAANALASSSTAAITASIVGAATLSGTTTVNAVAGVATFTNLKVAGAGAYTLKFAATGLGTTTSSSFTTTQSPASLSIQTQPSGAVSGSAFATQPVVRILDNAGLLIASGSNSTLRVTASRNSGSATLGGTTSISAVGGVATFTDLAFTGTGTGSHSLAFTATLAGISVNSSNFTVQAGAATRLSISTQPAVAVLGIALATQPVVQLLDANGNVTNSTAAVSAAIGTSAGGTIAGTSTVNAVGGTATFTNLQIAGAGGAYTLAFTSTGLSSATSSSFTVTGTVGGGGGGGTVGDGAGGTGVLASSDFESGYGTLNNDTPGHNAIISDPTGGGHGKVLQITYAQASGASSADLNQYVSYQPTSGLGAGSTTYFSGNVYFPANTVNFTNDNVLRKLTYWRTNITNNGQCDFVLYMFGNQMGVSVATPSHTTTKYNVFAFQAGAWYNLQIQVTMNSRPGAADGVTRVWINGTLVYEKLNEVYVEAGDPATTRWNWLTAGHQREGSSGESSISEVRYWDNVQFSTSR